MNTRHEIISALDTVRCAAASYAGQQRNGFRTCAICLFTLVERTAAPEDLWTALPEDPKDFRTVGDYLAAARRAVGCTA